MRTTLPARLYSLNEVLTDTILAFVLTLLLALECSLNPAIPPDHRTITVVAAVAFASPIAIRRSFTRWDARFLLVGSGDSGTPGWAAPVGRS